MKLKKSPSFDTEFQTRIAGVSGTSTDITLNLLKPTGHVMHQQFNRLKPSGLVMYHKVEYSKILHGAHFALSVLYGYQNRQRLFPYTSLNDWLL